MAPVGSGVGQKIRTNIFEALIHLLSSFREVIYTMSATPRRSLSRYQTFRETNLFRESYVCSHVEACPGGSRSLSEMKYVVLKQGDEAASVE